MACEHQVWVAGYWETEQEENWYTGEMEDASVFHRGHYEDTFVDLDLHRMKCTQCGKIKYYSGAAHDYYENGIKSGIFSKG